MLPHLEFYWKGNLGQLEADLFQCLSRYSRIHLFIIYQNLTFDLLFVYQESLLENYSSILTLNVIQLSLSIISEKRYHYLLIFMSYQAILTYNSLKQVNLHLYIWLQSYSQTFEVSSFLQLLNSEKSFCITFQLVSFYYLRFEKKDPILIQFFFIYGECIQWWCLSQRTS